MSAPGRALLRLDEVSAPRTRRGRDGQLRKVSLAGEAVDYRLIRARRRTIGMEVDLTGLTVRAPRWVTLPRSRRRSSSARSGSGRRWPSGAGVAVK